jgi:SHS2 domain-containing protein
VGQADGVVRLRRPVPYEELDHTADAGVIVRGRTQEDALARLVLAYADLVTGGAPVASATDREIEVEPGDFAGMAVDVLRELLFRFETERWVPESCEVVHFDPARGARLVVGTGPYDPVAHADGLVLKAVTLHAARFEPEGGGWVAGVVFDV